MENLKIKVRKNLDELVDLFKQYGCKSFNYTCTTRNYILLEKGMLHFCKLKSTFNESKAREVNIDQLRDLVVLKRNDAGDATHVASDGSKYLKCFNYFCFWNGMQWRESLIDFNENNLKPIEKTMKEYLVKDNITSKYCFIESEGLDADGSDVIELPKGTELVVQCKDGTKEYFKDGCGCKYWSDKLWHRVSIPFAHIEESNLIWLKEGCQAYWDPKYSSKLPSPFNYVKKREMKEFLVNHDDKWTLQLLDSDTEENSYRVAVPKDATEARLNKSRTINFIRSDGCWMNEKTGGEWFMPRDHSEHKIVWQRSETKSINDQYAEIEKVREKTVSDTLKERQKEYGSFEDVAFVTQGLIGFLSKHTNYDDMPNTHKESLHMIASKVARLTLGNCNHKDSWHDIGGYSKLIEDLLD